MAYPYKRDIPKCLRVSSSLVKASLWRASTISSIINKPSLGHVTSSKTRPTVAAADPPSFPLFPSISKCPPLPKNWPHFPLTIVRKLIALVTHYIVPLSLPEHKKEFALKSPQPTQTLPSRFIAKVATTSPLLLTMYTKWQLFTWHCYRLSWPVASFPLRRCGPL